MKTLLLNVFELYTQLFVIGVIIFLTLLVYRPQTLPHHASTRACLELFNLMKNIDLYLLIQYQS